MMPNKTLQHILAQINRDDIYIKQAFDYYHERFLANHRAQDFVNSSPLLCETMKQNAHIGLCDRTLGRHLPSARTMEGGAIRGHYRTCGLFRASGCELFRGYIVFPCVDGEGVITSAVGYRYGRIRDNQPAVIEWQKPATHELVVAELQHVKELIHGKANQ